MRFGKDRREEEMLRANFTCGICGQRRPHELDVHSRSGQHLRRSNGGVDDALVVCSTEVDGGDSCHNILHMVLEAVPKTRWRDGAGEAEVLTRRVIRGQMDILQAKAILSLRVNQSGRRIGELRVRRAD